MGKGTVLVIDDSPIVRKLAEMALVDEGYQVATAENGEDGLRLAEEIRPSVILVDFIMPRMSGYQFCQLIREDHALKDIPIILITAKGDDVGRKFSERFAVSDYFIKPFKSEALVDKVNSIVLAGSGTAKDVALFETQQPFVEEPAVDLPFSFEAEQPFGEPAHAAAATSPFAFAFEPEPEQPAAAAPGALDDPGLDIPATFDASAFAFEPEPEQPAAAAPGALDDPGLDIPATFDASAFAFEPEPEQPAAAELAVFEVPKGLDIPVTFDASAFAFEPEPEQPAAMAAGMPEFEESAIVAPLHEETASADIPSIDITPFSDMETGHELEAVPYDQVTVAAEEPTSAEPFVVPPVPVEIYAAAGTAAVSAAAFASLSGESASPVPEALKIEQVAAMPVEGLAQYLETALPFIVQKSVDAILKQNGIIRDSAVVLSGNFEAFDICDVLGVIEKSCISGKLFAFLPAMSAELYFDRGKAVGASVSIYSGVKKRINVTTGSDMMLMRALLVDTVADIVESSTGAFSVEQGPVQHVAAEIPLRLGSAELIQAALAKVSPDSVAGRIDDDARLVRAVDQSAIGLLSLRDAERTVLGAVDGQKTAAEVVAYAGGNSTARFAVYALIKLGVLKEIG